MESKPKTNEEEMTVNVNIEPFLMPIALIISTIIFSFAFIIGMGKVSVTGGDSNVKGTTATADTNDDLDLGANDGAVEPNPDGTVNVDDDAVKGDLDDAKVVIVEFSDYECPFCERFYTDTLPSIESNFIENGDVALVYRDLPLSFHAPGANREANATECVREQLDDEAYFEMHNYIFENTPGNGPGIAVSDLVEFGGTLGADEGDLEDCITNAEFQDEIDADAADAAAAGISGTPGFIIGTLGDDGVVTGELVSGAQPFSVFEATINKYLED